jgi:serine phosphatase RsbU (regulator of sigma subunit)
MNERGELYGAQRLARALGALPADSSPDDITAVVLEDVKRFVSSASASDDLTLLALRRSSGR